MEDEVPLLRQESKSERKWSWRSVGAEAKRATGIAAPMMVVMVSQYLVRAAPMFMLGHLGELSLSSASIATSLCNATGFTVLFGMASALDTMCGQANGAEQYEKMGVFGYASVVCLLLVSAPICVVWMNAEKLLTWTGQDPLIAAAAGVYVFQLIPALLASAFLQTLVRFLQSQSLILPMLWSSLASLCIELPLCWALVFKLGLGSGGAALSIIMSSWFNVCCLLIYVGYSPACRRTTMLPSGRDVLGAMWDFARIGVPSAFMYCLEGWTYELIILLSGLLPNPQLETSIVTMCYMIAGLHSYIPYSLGAAISTLVSNELGAGKPDAARFAVHTVVILAVGEFLIAAVAVYTCRHIIGFAFSREKMVINYIDEMAPLICISMIMDGISNVLSGVVRGSGWQEMGAYVNLGAFYLVGVPVGLVLGFVLEFKGKGLLGGLVAGSTVQALLFSVVTSLTDWEKQARETRLRIVGRTSPIDGSVGAV